MTDKILIDRELLERIVAGEQPWSLNEIKAALSAPQQEAVAFPELPNTPYCRPDGAPLYDAMMMHQYAAKYADTHPAPSVPEVFDKSKLKRIVTQVFGEGYQIVPPSVKGEKE